MKVGALTLLLLVYVTSQTSQNPCLARGDDGKCLTCGPSSYLKDGACVSLPNGCVSIDTLNGGCQLCLQGFSLTNGDCLQLEDNSSQMSQNQSADSSVTDSVYQAAQSQKAKQKLSNTSSKPDADQIQAGLFSLNPSRQNSTLPLLSPLPLLAPQPTLQITSQDSTTTPSPSLQGSDSQPQLFSPQPSFSPSFNSSSLGSEQSLGILTTANYDSRLSATQLSASSESTSNPYGFPQGFKDPYCNVYGDNFTCVRCASRFVFNSISGLCSPVSSQCNTFDATTGACLTCYPGYSIQDEGCVVARSNDFCQAFSNGGCTKCYTGYLLVNGICVTANNLCKTVDWSNKCATCYPGYTLTNGECKVIGNIGCSAFDNIGRCIRCSKGYFYQGGVCVQANPLCKTFDANNGSCLTCYTGYTLFGSSCIVDSNNTSYSQNCATFDNSQNCVQCAQRYVMSEGKCTAVSDFCNTYDPVTGFCTSCYQGFGLKYGYCFKTIVIPINGSINAQSTTSSLQQTSAASTTSAQSQSDSSSANSLVNLSPPSLTTSRSVISDSGSGLSESRTVITTTTTPSSYGNPCLKYDVDNTTCLLCIPLWTLSKGVCGLGSLPTLSPLVMPSIYPLK